MDEVHAAADSRLRAVRPVEQGGIEPLPVVLDLDGQAPRLDGVPQRDPGGIGVDDDVGVRL